MNPAELRAYKLLPIQEQIALGFVPKRDWVEINESKGPMLISHHKYTHNEFVFSAKCLGPSYSDRKRISLPDSRNFVQLDGWYSQKGSSCTVWALVNGLHILGLDFNAEFIRSIHNYSLEKKIGGLGISFGEVQEFMEKYQVTDFNLRKAKPLLNNYSYQTNAEIIKGNLDKGNIILTSVNTETYLNMGVVSTHALCIPGYIISGRYMDLQVIDPKRGGIWTSLEHITSAVALHKQNTYILSTNDQQ